MKIAIFTDNFYPELSGISDVIIWQAKELQEQGHTISIYAPKYSEKDYLKCNLCQELNLGKNISINRFYGFPLKVSTGQAKMVMPNILRWIKVNQFDPEIIHTHNFFGIGLEAVLASKILNIPLVGTNHTVIKEYLRYLPGNGRDLNKISMKYVIWYYKQCDLVTSPSQTIIEEMKTDGLNKPVKVIHNPIDLKIFNLRKKTDKKAIKKRYGLSDSSFVYAGRLAPEKNLEVILKAIAVAKKRVPDINFALAGTGVQESKLKDLAKKLNIEKEIKFLGFINKNDLADLYRSSEAFVITSMSEVQSMSLLQAMACGLPAIIARSDTLLECMGQGNGLVVDPYDPQELAKNMADLISSAPMRKEFSHKARKVSEKYNPSLISRQWEELYLGLIKEHNAKNI